MADDSVYRFGSFELLVRRQLLIRAGTPVRIGSRALGILTALVEACGELVAKETLIAVAWPTTFVDDSNLKVNIANIRRVLEGKDSTRNFIATVPGRGYRFIAPVHRMSVGVGGLPPKMPIIGRAEDLAVVQGRLSKSSVVTVVGTGGIGKTAVASAAAYAVAALYPDGVSFVDLAKISDARFIPAALAFALGVTMGGEDRLAGVIHALKGQQKLLLIDNCEHLLPTVAGIIDRLSTNLEGVRILATSREPLRIRDEQVHRLDPLPTDPRLRPTASEASGYPAVELFVTRAFERTGYDLSDADAPSVAEICRRLDGIPLAIELAATRIDPLTPARLLEMLDDRFKVLAYGCCKAPLRQRTLNATLDWSYDLLSENEAAFVRALSVFAGAFGVEGAVALTAHDTPPETTVNILSSLAAKSFVVVDWQDGAITYRLLETTRTYLLERLQFNGEENEASRRHATFICVLLECAGHTSATRSAREWGAKFGRYLDDVRRALAWAASEAQHASLFVRLTLAAHPLWDYFSLTEECRVQAGQAIAVLDAARLVDTEAEMRLQAMFAAASSYTVGMAPETLSAMRRTHELATRFADKEYELRALWQLGVYLMNSGQPEAAIEHLESFKSVAAAAKNSSACLDGERLLGTSETFAGHLLRARRRLDELAANAHPTTEGAPLVRFHLDRDLGVQAARAIVLWLLGRPGEAGAIAELGVEQAIARGHELSLCNMVVNGSCPVALWSGRFEHAERDLSTLEERFDRHSSTIFRPLVQYLKAELMVARGEVGALDAIRAAIAGLGATHHSTRMPLRLGVLAEAQSARGLVGEAAQTIGEAIERAELQKERWCLPELLRIRASINALERRSDEVEALLLKAMKVSDEIGALSWRLRAANDLAQLWRSQDKERDALRMLKPIFAAFTENVETADLRTAANLLSKTPSRSVLAKTRTRKTIGSKHRHLLTRFHHVGGDAHIREKAGSPARQTRTTSCYLLPREDKSAAARTAHGGSAKGRLTSQKRTLRPRMSKRAVCIGATYASAEVRFLALRARSQGRCCRAAKGRLYPSRHAIGEWPLFAHSGRPESEESTQVEWA